MSLVKRVYNQNQSMETFVVQSIRSNHKHERNQHNGTSRFIYICTHKTKARAVSSRLTFNQVIRSTVDTNGYRAVECRIIVYHPSASKTLPAFLA